MKISRFEDLECWQEARKLARMVYSAVEKNVAFQRDLRFVGQNTAASVSIMHNIAEGWASNQMRRSSGSLRTQGGLLQKSRIVDTFHWIRKHFRKFIARR